MSAVYTGLSSPPRTTGHQCHALAPDATSGIEDVEDSDETGAVSWFQVGRVFVNTLFRYVDVNICTDTERSGHMIT